MTFYMTGIKNVVPQNVVPVIKEEAMGIKNQLQNSDFDGFAASDRWLDKRKSTYAIKAQQIVGEAGDLMSHLGPKDCKN